MRKLPLNHPGITLLILLLSILYLPANAQTPISILSGEVNQSVWVGNAIYQVNHGRDYEKIVLVSALIKMYESNPNLDPVEALKLVNQAQDKYNAEIKHGLSNDYYLMGRTEMDVMNSMYNVASTLPFPINTAAALAKESFEWALKETKEALEPDSRVLAQGQLYNSQNVAQDFHREQWSKAFGLAQGNASAAQALNTFFGPYLNANTNNTSSEIFDKNPSYAQNEEVKGIRKMIGSDGAINTTLEELRKQSEQQFKSLITMMADDRKVLNNISRSQKVLLDYVADQKLKEQIKNHAEKERRIHQLKIEAVGSSVYLISTFIGFHNPKLGQVVQVIGSSAIQLSQSINKFTMDAAQLGDPGVSFGSIVFTANVLGTAMKIFSLFAATKTTDQVILEQVIELRKQIGEIRKEMHDRFDRIDRSLNAIYETLNTRFDQIDYKLGVLNGNVDEIRKALFSSQADLNRLERNLYAALNEANSAGLKFDINGGIGYRKRTGSNLSYDSKAQNYVGYENSFYTWAVDLSHDELRAGLKQRDFSDAKVYDELNNLPLDANLNYVTGFVNSRLVAKGVNPIAADTRLINPRIWALSTSAYLQLAQEWSKHFQKISTERLSKIKQYGQAIRQLGRNITVINNLGGSEPNLTLFKALFDNYKEKAKIIQEKLAAFEKDYCENIFPDSKLKPFNKSLDLWGGAFQKTDYYPLFTQIGPCHYPRMIRAIGSEEIPILSPPDSIEKLIPKVFRLAEQIGLGNTSICVFECSFTQTRVSKPPKGLRRPDVFYSHLLIKIHGDFYDRLGLVKSKPVADSNTKPSPFKDLVYFMPDQLGLQIINQKFVSTNEQYHGNVGAPQLTPVAMLNQNWENGEGYKKKFVSSSTKDESLSERENFENLIADEIEAVLKQHQRAFYFRIIQEMDKQGGLERAIKELSGAKKLLESFVILGMPRSLETNDLLRSLLFGSQGVLESESLKLLFYEALTHKDVDTMQVDTEPGKDSTINTILSVVKDQLIIIDNLDSLKQLPRIDLPKIMDVRLTALENEVNRILKEVADGKRIESMRLVEIVLGKISIVENQKAREAVLSKKNN